MLSVPPLVALSRKSRNDDDKNTSVFDHLRPPVEELLSSLVVRVPVSFSEPNLMRKLHPRPDLHSSASVGIKSF
jgi:hypothetical protein